MASAAPPAAQGVQPDDRAGPRPSGATPGGVRSFGSGARVLSVGIASTGVLTFAYFSISSHVLGTVPGKRITLLWTVMFVINSAIYRPIEQLLSRTIADRQARGESEHRLGVAVTIQLTFAALFAIAVLALHSPIQQHVFNGYASLYWVLVGGTLAYAGSYFARGWLAGHEYFALYGGLVLMESVTRVLFAVAVAVGIASGETTVALGIAAAPFVSLLVIPAAFARRGRERAGGGAPASPDEAADAETASALEAASGLGVESSLESDPHATPVTASAGEEGQGSEQLTAGSGTRFALAVSGIQLSEQTILNAAVLVVAASSRNPALSGIVFYVLLIARAPLQLFQAIQTSLLPHLTGLEVTEGHAAFSRAIRITLVTIAGFAVLVALGLLVVGPFAMHRFFGPNYPYTRLGLAVVGVGMGMHLTAGTLNQAALARDQARWASVCWGIAAIAMVAWMVLPAVSDQLTRAEIGYAGATGLLSVMLAVLYLRGHRAREQS